MRYPYGNGKITESCRRPHVPLQAIFLAVSFWGQKAGSKMAGRMGISLGKTNYVLTELANKGIIKIKRQIKEIAKEARKDNATQSLKT